MAGMADTADTAAITVIMGATADITAIAASATGIGDATDIGAITGAGATAIAGAGGTGASVGATTTVLPTAIAGRVLSTAARRGPARSATTSAISAATATPIATEPC
ncbi:hypothetical protein B1812_02750 [Methylocystis bryophila]|uniref:Uncharacterized protein n=1 Tax=Methylocystis bryophila TaxID=655015 RepID=A0A1W6MRE7_9HYPH|nr:hypothetical protein B1812_02750 [Methylocystis bryophila]